MAKLDDFKPGGGDSNLPGPDKSGPDEFRPQKSQADESHFGKFATVGLEIAVGAGLGALIGTWLDRKWHSDPWGVVIGTFIGIAAGMYLLIKEANKANKN